MTDAKLLALLHLCDSLFPTGGYAHSDGLEAAVADSRVKTAVDLDCWLDASLRESFGSCDGLAVVYAMQAVADARWEDVRALDEEIHALRPSSTARAATRHMGRRLLRTWMGTYPDSSEPFAAATRSLEATLPVAFGIVCASIGITSRAAVEAFAYTRLAATMSCAMRLLPIGQHEAHAKLATALARVPPLALDIERRADRGDRPGMFAPGLDLAAMSQRHVHSRLFLS